MRQLARNYAALHPQQGVDQNPLRETEAGTGQETEIIAFIKKDHVQTTSPVCASSSSSLLYTTFVDFEKAFDSVDRETMWKLMQHYRIPQKLINVIQQLYEDSSCRKSTMEN